MPGRSAQFANGEFYHLFNRGSDKRDIFLQPRDYERFRKTFYYYQFIGPKIRFSKFTKSELNTFKPSQEKKLVDIVCFCLMPNHFHFLVRQVMDKGASIFMSQLSNSYTKYFNTKYPRVGSLFQGTFKAVHVNTDEQLLHLSRYIHLNPIVSGLAKDLSTFKWSSFSEYASGKEILCSISTVLNFFPSSIKYKEFLEDQINYGTTLETLKHQTIDLE